MAEVHFDAKLKAVTTSLTSSAKAVSRIVLSSDTLSEDALAELARIQVQGVLRVRIVPLEPELPLGKRAAETDAEHDADGAEDA